MGETVFAIIALGLPGFFTYAVLVKRNILIYTKDQKDEKVMLIGLLSLTNIAVIMLLLESFNLEVMSIAGFFIIVSITLLLTFWIYPFVIRNGRRMLEDHLEKTGQNNLSISILHHPHSVIICLLKTFNFLWNGGAVSGRVQVA